MHWLAFTTTSLFSIYHFSHSCFFLLLRMPFTNYWPFPSLSDMSPVIIYSIRKWTFYTLMFGRQRRKLQYKREEAFSICQTSGLSVGNITEVLVLNRSFYLPTQSWFSQVFSLILPRSIELVLKKPGPNSSPKKVIIYLSQSCWPQTPFNDYIEWSYDPILANRI